MIAKALGIEPIIGIMAGSVSMIGGLGTAGAFGPYYEQLLGIPGTASAAVAAATFGMVAGTILGAPVGERIIKMHKVKTPYENPELMEDEGIDMIEDHVESGGKQFNAQDLLTICMWIGLALGIGTIVSAGLSILTPLPAYIGAMICAAVIRNVGDFTKASYYNLSCTNGTYLCICIPYLLYLWSQLRCSYAWRGRYRLRSRCYTKCFG